MKQVINMTLKIKPKRVNIPKKIKPHITLVYPFEIPNQQNLKKHIEESIKGIKSFEIKLEGLKKSSKDYYLYLLINQGKSKIIRLHRKLNSGILRNFRNKGMRGYIPHITLGIFKSKREIDFAMKNPKFKNQKFRVRIDSIQLLTLNRNNLIKSTKNFKLKP